MSADDRYTSQPVLAAADVVADKLRRGIIRPRIAPPRAVIMCFQPSLLAQARQQGRTQRVSGFLGELLLLRNAPGVAVAGGFGVGAPAAVALLEELAAFGPRQFVALGLAGGVQSDLRAGDLIVCERALRDEGTSAHYIPAARFAGADPRLTVALSDALTAATVPFRTGASWTTDAPYRETRAEVAQYRSEGILTVEMEAAALFAAGARIGIAVAAAFAVADVLEAPGPSDADRARAAASLRALLMAATRACAVKS